MSKAYRLTMVMAVLLSFGLSAIPAAMAAQIDNSNAKEHIGTGPGSTAAELAQKDEAARSAAEKNEYLERGQIIQPSKPEPIGQGEEIAPGLKLGFNSKVTKSVVTMHTTATKSGVIITYTLVEPSPRETNNILPNKVTYTINSATKELFKNGVEIPSNPKNAVYANVLRLLGSVTQEAQQVRYYPDEKSKRTVKAITKLIRSMSGDPIPLIWR